MKPEKNIAKQKSAAMLFSVTSMDPKIHIKHFMTVLTIHGRILEGKMPIINSNDYYNSNNSLYKIIDILSIILIIMSTSCVYKPNRDVPEQLIEDVVIAKETNQYGWMYDNGYVEPGIPKRDDWVDSTAYTHEERELLHDMIRSQLIYNINYHGNRATVVVDYSGTGLMEWKFRNRMGIPPGQITDENRLGKNKLYHFIYDNNQWKYVLDLGGSTGFPEPEWFE